MSSPFSQEHSGVITLRKLILAPPRGDDIIFSPLEFFSEPERVARAYGAKGEGREIGEVREIREIREIREFSGNALTY